MSKRSGVLKLADLQQELGVSRWTLYEWLKDGKLHGFKLPCGHYRIPAEEVSKLKQELSETGRALHCHSREQTADEIQD